MCCSSRGTVAGRVRSLSDTWERRETGFSQCRERERQLWLQGGEGAAEETMGRDKKERK